MFTAEQWGIIIAIVAVIVVGIISWNVYWEIDAAIERRKERRVHRDNVEAWSQLFGCDETGHDVVIELFEALETGHATPERTPDIESTQVITLPQIRSPQDIGDDYAFAMAIRYFHTDEKRLIHA